MARKASSASSSAPAASPRDRAIDALMTLAAEMPWREIALDTLATRAGLSLADLRDLFPSKGAMLGAFIRRIDREVLEGRVDDLADSPARDRVLDLMLRRFDALEPHRAALRNIHTAFQGDILGLAALNSQALNSWRYLLASAGIETEGPLGYVKLQGAILVFARVFPVFLDEDEAGLPRTMAALDREIARGEWLLRRAEGIDRFVAPFRGFCNAAREARRARHARPAPTTDAA